MAVKSTDRDMLIQMYFDICMEYADIEYTLAVAHKIYVSVRHLKSILKKIGLSRQIYSDMNTVVLFIQEKLKGSGQLLGYRTMYTSCVENGYSVLINDVRIVLKYLDPIGVILRSRHTLCRRDYVAKEPNYL